MSRREVPARVLTTCDRCATEWDDAAPMESIEGEPQVNDTVSLALWERGVHQGTIDLCVECTRGFRAYVARKVSRGGR